MFRLSISGRLLSTIFSPLLVSLLYSFCFYSTIPFFLVASLSYGFVTIFVQDFTIMDRISTLPPTAGVNTRGEVSFQHKEAADTRAGGGLLTITSQISRWTVAPYQTLFSVCLDVRRCEAVCLDGRNAVTYDLRDVC